MYDPSVKYDLTLPRIVSLREEEIVADILQEFSQKQLYRNVFAAHWEEVSELIDPNSRNTFFFANYNWPGQKKTDRQIDATGMMALERFTAICDSLLTPRNSMWHQLVADNDYVMKDQASAMWFEQVNKILFKERYAANANFSSQNQAQFRSLGAYGTGSVFIDAFDGPERGLRYRALPLGETFFNENHQGLINGVIRWFRYTAAQAERKWPGQLPEGLRVALKCHSEQPFNFLHCVRERAEDDYDPERLDARGKQFQSVYVSLEGRCLMFEQGRDFEGGYRSFPLAASRYTQAPGELYGRSPAMNVLPALKTLNAMKRTSLKQAHRSADPVLLVNDDGLMNMSLRPGAVNAGGVTSDGKPLVHVLPTGNYEVGKEAMAEERLLINDAFLVTLFQILVKSPQMTATEAIERANEKGILLAPTVGRQQSEYLGPAIHRELDVLAMQRKLPPQPPRLREAQGSYNVMYTSPMSRAARSQEAAGFLRTLEPVKEIVAVTQDPSPLDNFDFDVIVPAMAEINGMPASWKASPEKIAQTRQVRAKQKQVQAQIQAAPAQAAMLKAQAVAAKSGQPQPGSPAPQ